LIRFLHGRKLTKHNECRSCGSILTIERLIGPKVGTELDVCLQCLITAFEEVLREKGEENIAK
jgi:hypothetical protein